MRMFVVDYDRGGQAILVLGDCISTFADQRDSESHRRIWERFAQEFAMVLQRALHSESQLYRED